MSGASHVIEGAFHSFRGSADGSQEDDYYLYKSALGAIAEDQ